MIIKITVTKRLHSTHTSEFQCLRRACFAYESFKSFSTSGQQNPSSLLNMSTFAPP